MKRTHRKLVTKLRLARHGSRDLDADILEALGASVKRGPVRRENRWGVVRTSQAWKHRWGDRGAWRSNPRLTTSLDSALSFEPSWRVFDIAAERRAKDIVYHARIHVYRARPHADAEIYEAHGFQPETAMAGALFAVHLAYPPFSDDVPF